MSEFYGENNSNEITVQICDKLFWGFSVKIDKTQYYNSVNNIQWVFDYVKNNLISYLELANLQVLVEKAKNIDFHIHHPQNNSILFLCTDCQKSYDNNK